MGNLNMSEVLSTRKIIAIILMLIAVSVSCTILLTLVNDQIFIEPIRDKQFREMFEAGKVPKPPYNGEQPTIELEASWPLRAIVFFYGSLSLYWFLLGGVIALKFKPLPKKALLLVPIVSNLMNLNLFLLLYVLFCFSGNFLGSSYLNVSARRA